MLLVLVHGNLEVLFELLVVNKDCRAYRQELLDDRLDVIGLELRVEHLEQVIQLLISDIAVLVKVHVSQLESQLLLLVSAANDSEEVCLLDGCHLDVVSLPLGHAQIAHLVLGLSAVGRLTDIDFGVHLLILLVEVLIINSGDIDRLTSRVGWLIAYEGHLDVLLLFLADMSSKLSYHIHEVIEVNLALVLWVGLLFQGGDEVVPLVATANLFVDTFENVYALSNMLLLVHRAEILTVFNGLDTLRMLATVDLGDGLLVLPEVEALLRKQLHP